MAYKTLLTFLELEEPIRSLDVIADYAQSIDAHLDIIVLGVQNPPPAILYDTGPMAEWSQINAETLETAHQKVDEIEQYVSEKGISAMVAAECNGSASLGRLAARYAICADICVLSLNAIKEFDSIDIAFNGVLFEAKCPLLLLPDNASTLFDMSKIMVAWNGRTEEGHAVRNALPILKMTERVNVVSIDPNEQDVGMDAGSDLAVYLARHGVNITVDTLASGSLTIAEKLLQRSKDIDASLVVMGGYGHTKLREWFLGGTTREMLEIADIPILMTH